MTLSLQRLSLPLFLAMTVALAVTSAKPLAAEQPQVYEVRRYQLDDNSDAGAIDEYLRDALVPALSRMGLGPIGVFAGSAGTGKDSIVVVVPYDDANQISQTKPSLAADAEYQKAAKTYLGRQSDQPPFRRVRGELLAAMDCWPKLKVPEGTLENDKRVYELRVYESPTEQLGDLKVHMFDNGEVPIFLDSGIQPIFIGRGLIGPQTPNLTYLTVYDDEAARTQAWKNFRGHPDWQVLKKVPKYQGTVSHIDTYVLSAKPYSQM